MDVLIALDGLFKCTYHPRIPAESPHAPMPLPFALPAPHTALAAAGHGCATGTAAPLALRLARGCRALRPVAARQPGAR
ncbi:hypothetical protein G6F22_021977 [Rhizopus arrhizus]|nr:hypothetical protein G6F22_021977 [Rhizopus arrhizus]